jgi:hypothetical protein
MTERHRAREAVQISTAVEDQPVLSATETYTAKRHELENIEQQLAHLHSLQAGGTRLDRDQTLDVLVLEADVLQLRNEAERLRAPMETEQLALDVSDVVEVWNHWCGTQAEAFDTFITALVALQAATREFGAIHDAQGAAMAGMPGFARLGLRVPTGGEALHNLLSRLPNGSAWIAALMSPQTGTLTVGQVQVVRDVHTTAMPRQAHHVLRGAKMARRG